MTAMRAIPPEPPVGTWVRDRFGGVHLHEGERWSAGPGTMPAALWDRMWEARGPLVECSAWGVAPASSNPELWQ